MANVICKVKISIVCRFKEESDYSIQEAFEIPVSGLLHQDIRIPETP